MGRSQGAALGTHRSRSIKMGSPTDWHLGSSAIRTTAHAATLADGLDLSGLRPQISGLGSQTSDNEQALEAPAQRRACWDVALNKPRPCDGPCVGARVWGNWAGLGNTGLGGKVQCNRGLVYYLQFGVF